VDLDAVEGGGAHGTFYRAGTVSQGGGAELNGSLQMASMADGFKAGGAHSREGLNPMGNDLSLVSMARGEGDQWRGLTAAAASFQPEEGDDPGQPCWAGWAEQPSDVG
jgi:hypothetical protein